MHTCGGSRPERVTTPATTRPTDDRLSSRRACGGRLTRGPSTRGDNPRARRCAGPPRSQRFGGSHGSRHAWSSGSRVPATRPRMPSLGLVPALPISFYGRSPRHIAPSVSERPDGSPSSSSSQPRSRSWPARSAGRTSRSTPSIDLDNLRRRHKAALGAWATRRCPGSHAANTSAMWRAQTQHANLSRPWAGKIHLHDKRRGTMRSLARAILLPSRSFARVGARTSCSSEITRAMPFQPDWETSD
jgi:hypothetical protein